MDQNIWGKKKKKKNFLHEVCFIEESELKIIRKISNMVIYMQ